MVLGLPGVRAIWVRRRQLRRDLRGVWIFGTGLRFASLGVGTSQGCSFGLGNSSQVWSYGWVCLAFTVSHYPSRGCVFGVRVAWRAGDLGA